MRRSNGSNRRQTWSPGGDTPSTTTRTKRRKRRRNPAIARRKLLFLVGICVLVWLWIITSVVSWISGNEKTSSSGNSLRGKQPDMANDTENQLNYGNTSSKKEDQNTDSHHGGFVPPTFQRYTENAPTCERITANDVSFTLVTQFSNDRLWMMKFHCERWGSQISVAILTNRTFSDVETDLSGMGCNTTQLSLQVLSASLYPSDEYPVNVLRNMALSKVTTSHVMYADVDFWESQDLRLSLHLPQVRAHLAQDHKHALVIPAFQLNRQCREWRECPEKNIPKMPKTRQELLSLLEKKQGYPFDPTNRGGHGSTLYSKWVSTQKRPGDMLTIPCVYSNRYEPYLAFRYCRDLPPFQEAFSGYGKNKMSMVMHMLRSGYRLDQLGGGAFLVHYPHLDSKSRMEWNESPEAVLPQKINGKWHKKKPESISTVDWLSYKRGRVDATFVAFRKWLKRNVPDEAVIHKCRTAEDDDAKLWYDRTADRDTEDERD